MVPGSTVGSAKQLKPVTILAVANSSVDKSATDTIAEPATKSLMDEFPQTGTKVAAKRRQLILTGHGHIPVRGVRSARIGTYVPKFA